MTNETSDNVPFEKKTERLDIRVSHAKKKAFAEACENQGDTPSNAVRRFISTYVRREQRDERAAAIRFSPWKRYVGYFALGGILLIGVAGIWTVVEAQKQDALAQELFALYDKNGNNLIDLGEISSNDYHLQRVLNIDGVDGISPSEFMLQGKMVWQFVNPETYQIVEDKAGVFKQTAITRKTVSMTGEPLDPDQEMFISIDGKLVELTPDITEKERLELLSQADALTYPEDLEHPAEYSGAYLAAVKKYAPKMVTFDLQNPGRVNITVLEQQPSVTPVQSLSGYERSVDWVEGRPTPELVMGKGRENAVLTVPGD